ncbi:threonine/serine exporter family protein [Cytobacillus sp. Hz8]|uniref:threonine/serine exporter family protein n=1 Tax=Cytobacillus sp. Hz8 TaxID=3347168 RepID=UPI0035D84738
MEDQEKYTYDVMEVCLLAGKIMLQSGAETYRVEDTMMWMARAFGIAQSHSYVTPTAIIFSIEGIGQTKTRLVRITNRTTDLEKVTIVNSISRSIHSGSLNVHEAYESLKKVEKAKLQFPLYVQILSAAISSGCFVIMFQGGWYDFIPAFFSGGVGLFSQLYFHRLVPIKFFSEFLSAFVIGFLAYIFVKIGLGTELDKIIIGSVMPLVPGLLITNAVRDLMAGHFVSGLSKGAEAFLTAFAIGAGIAVILTFV